MTTTNNAQRDDLAELILDVGEYIPGSHADDYISPTRAADAILAAGYCKPRTITAVEELDALPEGSRVWGSSHRLPTVPGTGSPYVKHEGGDWWDYGNDYSVPAYDIMLPAVVVWEPEAGEAA